MKKNPGVLIISLFSLLALSLAAVKIVFLPPNIKTNSGCPCDFENLTGRWQEGENEALFLNRKVKKLAAKLPVEKRVLGAEGEEKWIEIDLSDQRLYAWQGDRIVYNFLISSGKWAPTPKGNFRIWVKLRYTKMSGGSRRLGTYYYLPNVPYVMYFYKGYGLHGTYWHNNFGTPMSHGCINLSIQDAGLLFNWANPYLPPGKWVVYPTRYNPGTRVVIHD